MFLGLVGQDHIIINKKPDTVYTKCPSGHFVTISPGSRIESNCKEFSDAYSFTCYTTCRGGINRRNVCWLFALYSK